MKKLALVTLAIVFAVCGVNAQNLISTKSAQLEQKPEVLLRLNLRNGQVFKQEMNMKMNVKMEVAGMKIDTDVPFFAFISYKVLGVKDNNFTLETSYDAIRMTMNIAGVDMSFDSQKKPKADKDNPMSILSGMVGKKFLLTLDEMGNVVKVEGMEKLFDEMLNSKNMSKEQKKQMQSILASIFSEDKFAKDFSSTSVVFPKEPVKEGFEWKTESKQSVNDMSMLSYNKFRIEQIAGERVIISSISEYKIDGDLNDSNTSTQIFMDKGDAKGHYVIDLRTGWTQDVKSFMEMRMKVVTKEDGKEMSIPMEITADFVAQTK